MNHLLKPSSSHLPPHTMPKQPLKLRERERERERERGGRVGEPKEEENFVARSFSFIFSSSPIKVRMGVNMIIGTMLLEMEGVIGGNRMGIGGREAKWWKVLTMVNERMMEGTSKWGLGFFSLFLGEGRIP